MNPEKIGVELNDTVQGAKKIIFAVTRKTDHQVEAHLEAPLLHS